MIRVKIFFLTLIVAISCHASVSWAEISPVSAHKDNRIRFINYDPYNVTKIIGSIRSSVQIEFANDENIAYIGIGNSVAWQVAPAGHFVFLKPREVQPTTNLQIVTTRPDGTKRSYQFELQVRKGDVSVGNDTYFLVKFRYPEDEALRKKLAEEAKVQQKEEEFVDDILNMHEHFGPRNWAYVAQGSPIIEPTSVYDNGKTTTFTFLGNNEIPAIYLVSLDGQESIVPKSIKGNQVIVHAIAMQFTLRRGNEVLCIYNKGFIPRGINPETGTTSPSVQREVNVGKQP
ncbi:Type IV secretion system protein VirB9 protein precursor [Bartonella clarridgeiae 73]|uniref:Type IV secretion system protein VirB9 protein n=1 Tax=Bartonella clarridgeiae (strain CCUG 45776 / CIP 104772 / 73) TaxID=696125 RepID=E6YFW6_BARC7|nr:P-type conjugative transfer protein VirB9 [Bartonella clarridgeiae]WCR55100.1 MAG: Outer membrane and periplasm component of type IV secretion of T-DNA complex has secretin-like domain VirB9 [Bartonella clarridgeiae]WCR55116.1 MAG: Outer membrane and periplasm component of type IV secretion of T-DNA complex has secretin-like domain VirB9 [Bartonella clarridgeiae]WCR55636.1 MAG: Outer membrane and periplasm component of type IV secretion of T-DNA complex has secretin-like domain VirB9 [Bartone